MTNEMQNYQVPSDFADMLDAPGLGEGISGGFPMINYRGKVWSLRLRGETHRFLREDDGTPLSYLDVVIVGNTSFLSKVYYRPGQWTEDSGGAPLCTSVRGDTPDSTAPEPQSPTCATCRHNEWRDMPNGKRGKECQDHKRLAVLLRPEMTTRMLGAPLDEPVYLKVPPGSLTALKSYGDSLAHRGLPTPACVTRIGFSSDRLFQMTFSLAGVLKNTDAPVIRRFLDDPQTKRILGLGLQPERRKTIPVISPTEPEPVPMQGMLNLPPPDRQDQAAAPASWEDSDDTLDQEVMAALGHKIQQMMK